MMTMPDIRSRALGYLRSGSVVVGVAKRSSDPTAIPPAFVAARVTGHRSPVYMVHLLDGRWSCSCKSQWDDGEPCAHLAAVQLVTGHESAAALQTTPASQAERTVA